MPTATAAIDALAAEFAELDARERLELLLEFANDLPPLQASHQAKRDAAAHRVHECQTPVYLWIDLVDQRIAVDADVPPEAPTVKGFVSVIATAIRGSTLAEALTLPDDTVQRLGLVQVLGMQRARGLNGILSYIRRQLARLNAAER